MNSLSGMLCLKFLHMISHGWRMENFYGKESEEKQRICSIRVTEDKDLSCEEWRIIEGFSVGHFCGLSCDLEH